MVASLECIYDGICHLGECPVWNVKEQKLFWTDILNRRIWTHNPIEESSKPFWEGEYQVGGFAFTEAAGMVLCTDEGVFLLDAKEVGKLNGRPKKLFHIPLDKGEMFNDITVDPQGRIFAGTLFKNGAYGTLYRLEKNKEPAAVIRELACSNGMTFSLDKKIFFHTDSIPKRITAYQYDVATGRIYNPTLFFEGNQSQGSPDGMTLDTEDHIWVAFWGEGVVRRLNPDGKIVEEIRLPAKQPSSVIFGGRGLSDLYITTACENGADIKKGLDEKGEFLGGPVYRYKTNLKGRPEWLADF